MWFARCLLLTAIAIGAARAQRFSFGACPRFSTGNVLFDWTAFGGKWYEVAKVPNFYEKQDKCISNTYSGLPPTVQMSLRRADANTIFKDYNATLTVANSSRGEFEAQFHDVPFGIKLPVRIVGTDYVDYAVLYSCVNILGLARLEFAWLKSRTKCLLTPSLEAAMMYYAKTGLSVDLLIKTKQRACSLAPLIQLDIKESARLFPMDDCLV